MRGLRATHSVVTSWAAMLFQQWTSQLNVVVIEAINHIPDQNQVLIPVPKIVMGPCFPSPKPRGKWVNCAETCVPSELETNRCSESSKGVRIYTRQGITYSVISEEFHGARRVDAVISDTFGPYCSVQGAGPHLPSSLIFILHGSECTSSCISTQDKVMLKKSSYNGKSHGF